jgi:hypothetical protein
MTNFKLYRCTYYGTGETFLRRLRSEPIERFQWRLEICVGPTDLLYTTPVEATRSWLLRASIISGGEHARSDVGEGKQEREESE